MSTAWICVTCATQYAPSDMPPASCPVCEDDRQYVDWGGQQWTTHAELVKQYKLRIGEDDGLPAIAVSLYVVAGQYEQLCERLLQGRRSA